MTIDDWLDQMPEDEREALCVADGWRAGAEAMFFALLDHGYIDPRYADDARTGVTDILPIELP